MHKGIAFLGLLILIAGIVIAFSNPIHIPEVGHWSNSGYNEWGEYVEYGFWIVDVPEHTEYPYSIVGAIICLIGFVTIVIGYYMKGEMKETQQGGEYVKLDAFLEPEDVDESEKMNGSREQED